MAETVLDRKTCAPGDIIFREGQEGNSAYIVQSGSVEIFKTVDGKDVLLGRIGKGGIFGEMALIDDNPRMASARAAEASVCIIISRNMFEHKLSKTDPFIRGLLKILAGQIRSLSQDNRPQPAPAETPDEAMETGGGESEAAAVAEVSESGE